MLLKDLLEQFNIAANTAFNKGYQELEPELAMLVYKFNSGNVSSTKFPITKIMSKISEFKGNRIHNSPADAFYVTIENKEFDGAIDIPRRDLLRAQTANSLVGLDMYVKEIESLGMEAKDQPYEDVLTYLEAGAASTYGTTFDQQPLFDTDHKFGPDAGSQSNLLSGTGTTSAQISADLLKAMAAIRGFYYSMDAAGTANAKKRKLNRNPEFVVICPDALVETFNSINKAEYLNSSSNTLKGMLKAVISRPFSDANDWYLADVSEANVKPFILSIEEEPKIQNPEMNDYALQEHKVMTWGLEGFSYGKAYGAWWKIVKTTN